MALAYKLPPLPVFDFEIPQADWPIKFCPKCGAKGLKLIILYSHWKCSSCSAVMIVRLLPPCPLPPEAVGPSEVKEERHAATL